MKLSSGNLTLIFDLRYVKGHLIPDRSRDFPNVLVDYSDVDVPTLDEVWNNERNL